MSDKLATLISEAKSITRKDAFIYGLLFVALITPGFLTICLYQLHLITSLSTSKLVLFSVAISSPVLVLNIAIVSFMFTVNKEEPGFVTCIGAFLTFIVFTIVIWLSFMLKISPKAYIGILTIMELIILVLVSVLCKKKKIKSSSQ